MDWDTDVAPAIIAGAMARGKLTAIVTQTEGPESDQLAHIAMELNASTDTLMKRLDELEGIDKAYHRLAEFVAKTFPDEIPEWPGEQMTDTIIRLLS